MRLIDADGLRKWLKKIPIHDLSDGKGLCRVIFEEDFARSMHMFDGNTIEIVRCKDCKYASEIDGYEDSTDHARCCTLYDDCYMLPKVWPDDFCSYGERREDDAAD